MQLNKMEDDISRAKLNDWLFSLVMLLEAHSEWNRTAVVLNKIRLQQEKITAEKYGKIIQNVTEEIEAK